MFLQPYSQSRRTACRRTERPQEVVPAGGSHWQPMDTFVFHRNCTSGNHGTAGNGEAGSFVNSAVNTNGFCFYFVCTSITSDEFRGRIDMPSGPIFVIFMQFLRKKIDQIMDWHSLEVDVPTPEKSGNRHRLHNEIHKQNVYIILFILVLFQYMRWYYLLGVLWMIQFIFACHQMTIAGSVASWYFTR